MTKKFFALGLLGLISGLTSAVAAETEQTVGAMATTVGQRFNCNFEGPAGIGKGVVPLVCSAFGEFTTLTTPPVQEGDHLTVVCGNAVVYSDGVIANFATPSTTELRSIVPLVANLTIRNLNPGVFLGALGAILRIDIPGTPQALLTGVCHMSPRVIGATSEEMGLQ